MENELRLEAFAEALANNLTPESEWRPLFVRLDAGDESRFRAFCRRRRIRLLDTIDRQLAELAAARLPSGSRKERDEFVQTHTAARGGPRRYGLWVCLPWESKAFHLLDPEDYFEVITNRNRDKITRDEQLLLRSKRVGVVGLSVGSEAAVSVAQEHLCGELRLADFDRLDLSNLNRINAGFDDLGLNKAIITARRIVKIDPYLRLTVVEEGVDEDNVEGFLDGLDLLIEECDNLPVKYLVRRLAKKRRLNIVYAGDERGFLSVEPYAHFPDLKIFHGRVDRSQPRREDFPEPARFWKALTRWLGGWENISSRSRLSLEQIGHTLLGYPQLAGEARYAAGQISHVARRLLLGERLAPCLDWFDPTEALPSLSDPPGEPKSA